MARARPTDADRLEAAERLLAGLGAGHEFHDIAAEVQHLHPRDNTFPGEVFMQVAIQAMDLAGVGQRDLPYEELLERHLTECELRGRRAQKVKFAILATGAARGGIDPDLLDEIIWWQTDDFWSYALAAAVAIVQACAAKQNRQLDEFVGQLSDRLGVEVQS